MNRAAEATLVIGGAVKGLLLAVGGLAVLAYGVYLLAIGHIITGLLLIFIGEPVIIAVADIATGLVLAVIVAMAGFLGWSLKRHDSEIEEPSWDV
jgi:hypothetical protein